MEGKQRRQMKISRFYQIAASQVKGKTIYSPGLQEKAAWFGDYVNLTGVCSPRMIDFRKNNGENMPTGVENLKYKAIYPVKIPIKLQKAGSLRLYIHNSA